MRAITVASTGGGGRTAWYRLPATGATVAAALDGDEGEDRNDGPPDERAARGAVARARPGGDDEQPLDIEWDGHGSGGGEGEGGWETRLNPGDAVAFATEQGGRVTVVGPGEVADITLASRASVVIVLPWAEGGRGNIRDVRTWVKVEIAQGAWVSRALAATRASRGEGDNGSVGGGEAEPDVDDPGRSHAASGSADPPPAETSAGEPWPMGQRRSQACRRPDGRPGRGRRRRGDGRVPGRHCPPAAAVDPSR